MERGVKGGFLVSHRSSASREVFAGGRDADIREAWGQWQAWTQWNEAEARAALGRPCCSPSPGSPRSTTAAPPSASRPRKSGRARASVRRRSTAPFDRTAATSRSSPSSPRARPSRSIYPPRPGNRSRRRCPSPRVPTVARPCSCAIEDDAWPDKLSATAERRRDSGRGGARGDPCSSSRAEANLLDWPFRPKTGRVRRSRAP